MSDRNTKPVCCAPGRPGKKRVKRLTIITEQPSTEEINSFGISLETKAVQPTTTHTSCSPTPFSIPISNFK
ncbi:hypothetical protein KM540_gp024 [Western grey kangaroopox virus]|uniref:Uncharacterized protein n=2 Tax=Macropopoxvirus TaxID=2733295 RepID=A0A2C9DSY6_9POXV|nr:hypothetical protein KM540_gp024 [Western grey kangaroopox virus]YP_010085309.1 hypothetical protein KM541_gp023 [Eastern grey kangaroopox virus]ATI20955.1 hypothetical protein [Western grey kangaroopox virus]ATI21119.1 hypothetical protein [Eastern grey kangaroopox virus]AXK50167.1 hypothetical protein EKPV-NSW-ORF036 [Eastern grey kangaroopox virus]